MRKSKDMPYHIGLKVKLYLSYQQKHIVAVNDGAKRSVYNLLVSASNEKYRLSKTAPYCPTDRNRLDYIFSVVSSTAGIKNALPYLNEEDVDSMAVDNAVRNYRTAWKNQKERHTGVPTFKKKSYEQSYQTNAHYRKGSHGHEVSNVRFEDTSHVILPKLGRVRIGGSPKLIKSLINRDADTRIGTITISRDSAGEYWASFQIASEKPIRNELKKTGSKVGIDLNLLELTNDSNGDSAANMRYYKNSADKLTKAQHKLSRMQEHAKKDGRPLRASKNYQKQRLKVAKIHRTVSRQREDCLHNLSKQKVESQDFIAAEDLKVRNLLKNHCLAGAITDAGWRKFLTMLQYKAELYGKTVILVPPRNTTQTCSVCGYALKGDEKLTLSDREWICPSCGTHHDRDTNAAKNILERGLQIASQS